MIPIIIGILAIAGVAHAAYDLLIRNRPISWFRGALIAFLFGVILVGWV